MKYIIGTGNYSMFDDSIGIRIIEYIYENNLDINFSAIDLSSNSLNLFSYLNKSTKQILLIDSLKQIKNPGSFVFFTLKNIETQKRLNNLSTHEGDIIKVLELAKTLKYYIPPITFMGIEAETIRNEFGLSETLKNNFQTYVKEAISFINADK